MRHGVGRGSRAPVLAALFSERGFSFGCSFQRERGERGFRERGDRRVRARRMPSISHARLEVFPRRISGAECACFACVLCRTLPDSAGHRRSTHTRAHTRTRTHSVSGCGCARCAGACRGDVLRETGTATGLPPGVRDWDCVRLLLDCCSRDDCRRFFYVSSSSTIWVGSSSLWK